MEREVVESRAIRSVGYDRDSRTLEIEFATGRVYQYADVPPEVHAWLLRVENKGGFLNRMIIDRYVAREVTPLATSPDPVLPDLETALRASVVVREAAPSLDAGEASELARTLYLPLARRISEAVRERKRTNQTGETVSKPLVVAVSGLPGSGKSTLALGLDRLLQAAEGLRIARFSLDDLYLSQLRRAELARNVHPLFAWRGAPGTHDVTLGLALMRGLCEAGPNDVTALPRFDKILDDPWPRELWPSFVGRPDVLLVDGWFWGTQPGAAAELELPINERELEEDPDGVWRRAVWSALGQEYQELFAWTDLQVHLEVPSHAASVRWRIEQGRQELRARGADPNQVDPERIERFLLLFQRVGRWPVKFERGYRVCLGEEHRVEGIDAVGTTQ